MVHYTETPAFELEAICSDLTKYLLVDMNINEEHFAELDKMFVRLCELRQYMHDVKFVKETV